VSEYRAALGLQPGYLVALENLGELLLSQPERREEGVALLALALVRETSPRLVLHMRQLLARVPMAPVSRPGWQAAGPP
jgi:hypothetical protein